MRHPKIVSLEGNIGAGKSSILHGLQKYIENETGCRTLAGRQIVFVREPVDIWESIRDPVSGDSILKLYYANEKKYAFTFQILAFISRLSLLRQTLRDHPHADIFVVERSLDADRHVFMQMLYDDGMIEDVERQVYEKWFQEFESEFGSAGIVYLECSPQKCVERIQLRLREGEDKIPLDYLEKLDRYHQNWMGHIATERTALFTINTNPDVQFHDEQFARWLWQTTDFIAGLLQPLEEEEKDGASGEEELAAVSGDSMNSDFGVTPPVSPPAPPPRSFAAFYLA